MDTTLSAPIGQMLDGRYLVESQVARGGMATVYLGRDVRLDRTVALKIAHPELASDPEFAARFISEARAVAKLSSPNVVAVFDQGTTGDINYIAMEYVPGPTLRELLNARGRLGPREALDIIEGVLAGLAAAHDAGIIHRDVKPENVLLGTGSIVKVADFGLARAAAGMRDTKTGMLIGTAAYLAPEQVSSGSSDQRTDVYAAGVMLFEMLTGCQPHTGDTPLAVAYKHVNAVVPAPSSLVPGLPSALDALVALATSRNPELRPPDARHYLQAIVQVRRGMPLPPVHRGAHAADARPAPGAGHYQGQQGGNAATFSMASTGRIGGPGPAAGLAGPDDYPEHAPSGTMVAANHTMIVPAGDDYQADGPYATQPSQVRGYREPFLQRWLFSKRIIAVLVALVVAVVAWWVAAGRYEPVPSVVRLSVASARAELTDAGLVVVLGKARHSNTVPDGSVIATYPAAGTRVTHGQHVTLVPSLGAVLITMPNVTGQTVQQAEAALKAAGLKAATPTQQATAGIPAGIVIATNPNAYQQWPANKPVQLVVSAGPPLPNFVGQQLSAAEAAAQQGGYTIDPQTVSNSSQPADTIISQSPQPGTPISGGEVVVVQVSPGPPNVPVPNVDGLTEHQAIQQLTAAGFQVMVQGGGFGGIVTGYSPTGQAPQGSTITITVFGL
ncbi:MAG TPA: Stk1 family PASTA domain-containing Ser/Thr kinase [Streptosporangiaceae bacterium]|nr:Stk1 family PASTA domain-containing Ser/Thr kinase [Streptosporangiaceae bacterium]